MTSERVSGSIWMIASPSSVLLRYWRWPVAPRVPVEPAVERVVVARVPEAVPRGALPGRAP